MIYISNEKGNKTGFILWNFEHLQLMCKKLKSFIEYILLDWMETPPPKKNKATIWLLIKVKTFLNKKQQY